MEAALFMMCRDLGYRAPVGAAVVCVLLFAAAWPAHCASTILTPVSPFTAGDVLTNYGVNSFDLDPTNSSLIAAWGGNVSTHSAASLQILDLKGGSPINLGVPSGYSGYWNSFTTFDPSGTSVWVGFTVGGNVDDRIYQVDLAGNWTQRFSVAANMDLTFYGGKAYLSAPNSGDWPASNKIWLLDSGGLKEIADVGGFAAGLAFDKNGNLYCGVTGDPSDNHLIMYTQQQIAAAAAPTGTPLARSAATNLVDLAAIAGGATGRNTVLGTLSVDGANHVLFNTTEYERWSSVASNVWMLKKDSGGTYSFDNLSDGINGSGLQVLRSTGDVTQGGSFFQAAFGLNGIAQVTSAPEPSTTVLLLAATAVAVGWRVRRRSVAA
jgi:hypothetical protein